MSSDNSRDNSVQWVLNYYDTNINKLRSDKNYTKESSKTLKFCTKCKKVWEDCRRMGGYWSKSIHHYDDFPSYGKPRETCFKCS